MPIPTILRGDTPSPISIRMPDGFPSGSDLILVYQGVERAYANINPGDVLTFALTRQEVAGMSIGTRAVLAYVRYADGDVLTVPSDDIRIKVTDCAGEVYGGSLSLPDMPGSMPDDATDGDSLADLKAKFNALKRVVTTSCIVVATVLLGADISPETTLNDIPGTTTVGDIVGASVPDWAMQPEPPASANNGSVTPQAVTNIVIDLGQQFGKVQSVNGKTGEVVLTGDDIETSSGISIPVSVILENANAHMDEYGNPHNVTAAQVGALPKTGGALATDDPTEPTILTVGAGALGGIIQVGNSRGYASILKAGKEVATEELVTAVSNRVESLGTTVNAWQTYWDGDDVRITVTNYYGSLDIPSLYLEQKMPAGDGHDAPWFRVVWDERTRWNTFMPAFTSVTNEVAQNKADRAWGVYDSSTGAYSPDGLLQVSQEKIMIASGMAWQKTITAGGCAVWILKATNPTTLSGETENGYFRITDGDGNPLFEVVKGDKRVVGAVATDLQVSGGTMTVRYNSVSDEHPTMEVCTDLLTPDWQTEDACTVARVTWGGSSGAWVATVTPIGAPRAMFARATFEAGGNTYIRNHVAASMDRVVVGGQEYTVTVQTVNGKKLLVLE